MTRLFRILAGSALGLTCFAQTTPLSGILAEELSRNFQTLQSKSDPAPYFISYAVTEQETCAVAATLGALQSSSCSHSRQLDVSLRVGSPKLDNYHRVQGERAVFTGAVELPIEDEPAAIRRRLWLETDRIYRQAAERFIKIQTSTQVRVASEDTPPDFTSEKPSVYSEPVQPLTFAAQEWESRVRKWSAFFATQPEILTSRVGVVVQRETKYFASTENTSLVYGRGFARITVTAGTKAADGMALSTVETFDAENATGLPGDSTVQAMVARVAKELTGLKAAPIAEPFVGPAILSGRAAGVFFPEIFGHRVEGHRQRDESEGQTFSKSIGTKVLPEFLSVTFDPTRRNVNGVDLNGSYRYDDEGVPAQRVVVVESGTLKAFLLSRSPVQPSDRSNGHGRRQPGFEVVSRQSNLLVDSSQQVSEERLRDMLREEIKRQNKPYGLYFQQVTGGYTQTGRGGLQAFAVIPILVYRVYADGRPDELVRGVDIVGTPLASFSKILSTSDRPEVFNGYCGAESGSVPVSAVSPALLVSEIETQRKETSTDRLPLLPRPPTATQP